MKIREITYCGVMVAIVAAFSLIPPIAIPILPVPISVQTMTVMLAGSLLGKKLGTFSVLIFLLLVAVGMPLLAGGRGGIGVFMEPTAGYLLSWPLCAFLIGWLVNRFGKISFWKYLLANLIGGMVVMNVVGALGLTLMLHLPLKQALLSTMVFFPGDMLKAVIVAFLSFKLVKRGIIKVQKRI